MDVLIVNECALPSGAAGINRHRALGRELVRRGHQVMVIASLACELLTMVAGLAPLAERSMSSWLAHFRERQQ